MVMYGVGFGKALVSTGWAISRLLYVNDLKIENSPFTCRASIFGNEDFPQSGQAVKPYDTILQLYIKLTLMLYWKV